tara:strand:- start:230 stop:790 length:561 start_codon:yes stop_codon:yes gene_type:complete
MSDEKKLDEAWSKVEKKYRNPKIKNEPDPLMDSQSKIFNHLEEHKVISRLQKIIDWYIKKLRSFKFYANRSTSLEIVPENAVGEFDENSGLMTMTIWLGYELSGLEFYNPSLQWKIQLKIYDNLQWELLENASFESNSISKLPVKENPLFAIADSTEDMLEILREYFIEELKSEAKEYVENEENSD